ncbi:hypothetical protein GC169_04850 [bacterium]|nr:hypothetical protein [bacterium]
MSTTHRIGGTLGFDGTRGFGGTRAGRWMAGAALALVMGAASAGAAAAQTAPGYTMPRTAWGAPDLQGTWNNTSITNLTRPRGVTDLVVDEATARDIVRKNPLTVLSAEDNARQDDPLDTSLLDDKNADRGYNAFWIDHGSRLADVKGELRTSWIVEPANGQIPFKQGARRNRGGFSPTNFDGPETRPLAERCLMSFSGSAGPVMLNSMYNNSFDIVQSPDAVVILVEMNHDARIIRLGDKHGPSEIPKWAGDSIGWYEGDTLVVETRNPHPLQGALISDQGKVTERFTRWSDSQILYEFTVDDPTLYTQAWKGEMALNAQAEPLYEYACHEGNYSFEGILGGARELESRGIKPSLGPGIFAGIDIPE